VATQAFDVVVVGTGPGGYVAAIRCAQLGLSVATVEDDRPGGVCLNWGCIPTKALLRNAEVVGLFQRAQEFGITVGEWKADYAQAVQRSRKVADRMAKGVEFLFRKNKITLFPGTGTMQTRVAYFLFIPWMYLDLESRRVASSEIAARARSIELRLIDVLASSSDGAGTIGVQARRLLQRLPSSIYWQGLHVWGIRLPPGSQDTYHRSLDACYTVERRNGRNDDGEPIDGTVRRNWHRSLPPSPAGFPKDGRIGSRQVLRRTLILHSLAHEEDSPIFRLSIIARSHAHCW